MDSARNSRQTRPTPAPGDPEPSGPPRSLEILGHRLWGLFIFAAMFVGQLAVVAWFLVRQEGRSIAPPSIRVVGDGLTISLSVIMGLPAVLAALWLADPSVAHAVRRLSRAALDLMDAILLIGVVAPGLVLAWDGTCLAR